MFSVDLSSQPTNEQLREEFEAAAETEPAAGYIHDAYRTGIMFQAGEDSVALNESCISGQQGQMLWHLTRTLRPETIIETGFGRGTSAAFFLSALAPWNGTLTSIDPAYRHWAGNIGRTFIEKVGGSDRHRLLEQPSEIALALMLASENPPKLRFSYVDGSHHFDGTLIDFIYLDRMTEIGGVIAIDDAHAPAVRTVASFVSNNYPYRLHYASKRLLLCQKLNNVDREWCHFEPFQSSQRRDWNVHEDMPDSTFVPNATFSKEL
jgi:predicted O-methyltransferase YrrM